VRGRRNATTAHITIGDVRSKAEQRRLLEKEGVKLDAGGGIRLAEFGWPAAPKTRAKPKR
jgi:alkylated DNA nucleotide flippase Atl1